MMLRRARVLLVLVPILLIVAACGSAPSGGQSRESTQGQTTASNQAAPAPPPAATVAAGIAPGARAGQAANAASDAKAGGAGAAPAGAPEAEKPADETPAGQVIPLDQKIIRTGRIDLVVADVGAAMRSVTDIIRAAGGYIQQSVTKEQQNVVIAEIVLRVPVEQYDGTFQELRNLSVPDKQPSEESTSQDVTEEFTDLQARIKNLRATEDQLVVLLGRAEKIEDILIIQRELTNVRGQIEQLQGRLNVIERRAAYSTISVTLRPQAEAARPKPPTLLQPAASATEIATRPTFRWSISEGATAYALQVASDIDTTFSNPLLTADGITATSFDWPETHDDLKAGTGYRWRVRASNAAGDGDWSQARVFTTVPAWNPMRTVSLAWEASLRFLQVFLDALLATVIFFWWLIPILGLIAWAVRSRLMRRRQRRESVPAGPTGPPPPQGTPAPSA